MVTSVADENAARRREKLIGRYANTEKRQQVSNFCQLWKIKPTCTKCWKETTSKLHQLKTSHLFRVPVSDRLRATHCIGRFAVFWFGSLFISYVLTRHQKRINDGINLRSNVICLTGSAVRCLEHDVSIIHIPNNVRSLNWMCAHCRPHYWTSNFILANCDE